MKRALALMLRIGAVALALNEIRGLILAGPIIYGLAVNGGGLMAAWIAFCSLAGIALSVVVPIWIARRLERKIEGMK